MSNLNNLEIAAQQLGHEIVIEQINGQWVIVENINDIFGFEVPILIGDTEGSALLWLTYHLSEKADE